MISEAAHRMEGKVPPFDDFGRNRRHLVLVAPGAVVLAKVVTVPELVRVSGRHLHATTGAAEVLLREGFPSTAGEVRSKLVYLMLNNDLEQNMFYIMRRK